MLSQLLLLWTRLNDLKYLQGVYSRAPQTPKLVALDCCWQQWETKVSSAETRRRERKQPPRLKVSCEDAGVLPRRQKELSTLAPARTCVNAEGNGAGHLGDNTTTIV